jgi:WD40 repeat protein
MRNKIRSYHIVALAVFICTVTNLQCRLGTDYDDDLPVWMDNYPVMFGNVVPVNESAARIEWDISGWPNIQSVIYRADSSGVFKERVIVPADAQRIFVDQDLNPGQGIYRYIGNITRKGESSPFRDTLKIQYGPTFKWLNYFGTDYLWARSVISPDNTSIFVSIQKGIRGYDLISGAPLKKFGDATVLAMAGLHKGTSLVTIEVDKIYGYWLNLWDAQAGTLIKSAKIVDSTWFAYQVAVSSTDAMVASEGPDSTIQLRTLPGLALVKTIQSLHTSWNITKMVFSPDNSMLLVLYGGGDVVFYDVNSGEAVRTVMTNSSQATSMVFTKDGSALVICSYGDKTTKIWKYPSMILDRTIPGETYEAEVGSNGLICIRNGGSLKVVSTTDPNYSLQYSGSFQGFSLSQDGSRIALINSTSVGVLSTDVVQAWHRIR